MVDSHEAEWQWEFPTRHGQRGVGPLGFYIRFRAFRLDGQRVAKY